jgi:2-amino-4-hydroxy-6-hydroxymethyldihydropteridine diphosphokinase
MDEPLKPVQAVLSLGSNIGDKTAYLQEAIAAVSAHSNITLMRTSSLYRTAPWGKTDQDWFINACVLIETSLNADDLLNACQHIEQSMGRLRDEKWGPRVIDIDIITYGEESHNTPHLSIPHKHVLERAFVLVPLFEICPDMRINGMTRDTVLKGINPDDVTRLD